MRDIIRRDLRHNWHPCSQMKDYEQFSPLVVSGAHGPILKLEDGRQLIDAVSSWWCKSLGHGHPRLKNALVRQMERFEHVIFANTTHDNIVLLSEKLSRLCPPLDRVFYACEGSTAVEIALKMCLQAQQLAGQSGRTRFVALEHGYHGESGSALAVSDLSLYRDKYRALLPHTVRLTGVPYVLSEHDPFWKDCSPCWGNIEKQLEEIAETIAGVIVEPVVQGAGGMRIYSPDFLRRLRQWCSGNKVYLIADEIMTGFGRTGRMLACGHAGVTPDFLCLAKGLTAGFLPLSAVLTSSEIYGLFYDDYGSGKSFLHSNTFSGHALAVAVALETLGIYEEEDIVGRVRAAAPLLRSAWREVADAVGCLAHLRGVGAVVAADLALPPGREEERAGYRVFRQAVEAGALLRPLGNTLYWLLPLNIEDNIINRLRDITIKAVRRALNSG